MAKRHVKFEMPLADALTEEETEQLTQMLLSGDESVKHKLVEGHMRLVISIAAKYATYFPNKKDDLVSEALLAATTAVNNAPSQLTAPPYNLTGYITYKAHSRLCAYIDNDSVIHIPQKQRGKVVIKASQYDEDGNDLVKNLAAPEKSAADTLDELMTASQLTDLQNRILALRIQNMNYEEIGEVLGISKSYVHRLLDEAFLTMRRVYGE